MTRRAICVAMLLFILLCGLAMAEDAGDDETSPANKYDIPDYVDYAGSGVTQYNDLTPGAKSAHVGEASDRLQTAINKLSEYYLDYYRNSGPLWLQNTSINYAYNASNSSHGLWLETVQPLQEYGRNTQRLAFAQGRISYLSGNSAVLNVGIGYRTLSNDMDVMYGANVFYDAGLYQTANVPSNYAVSTSSYNHQRIGIGLENFVGSLEGRFNAYLGISPSVELGRTADNWAYMERAASGMDIELGGAIPGANYLSVFGKGYYYFKEYNALNWSGSDLSGLGARINLQATPQLNLEIGADFNTGAAPRNYYGKLSFNLLALPRPALFGGNAMINSMSQYNLQNKFLQPVKRDNEITVERYTKDLLSAGAGSVLVTVYDAQGQLDSGAAVAILRGDCIAAQEATTDENGQAYFSGVPSGSGYYVGIVGSNNTLSNTSGYFSVNANSDTSASIYQNSGSVSVTLDNSVEGEGNVYVEMESDENHSTATIVHGNTAFMTDIPTGLQRLVVGLVDGDQYTPLYLSPLVMINQAGGNVTVHVPDPDVPYSDIVSAKVYVKNRQGLPVKGLQVEAFCGGVFLPDKSVATDDSGCASFSFTPNVDFGSGEAFGVFSFRIIFPDGSYALTDSYVLATFQPVVINYLVQ